MKTTLNHILRRICGTSASSPAMIYTAGRTYDLATHAGALRWRVRCGMDRVRDWPGNMKWRLANRLCWLAMRLRGDKPREGFYVINNRAADLVESIFFPLICTDDKITLTKEECEEIIEAAHALGRIANATSYVDYWTHSEKTA